MSLEGAIKCQMRLDRLPEGPNVVEISREEHALIPEEGLQLVLGAAAAKEIFSKANRHLDGKGLRADGKDRIVTYSFTVLGMAYELSFDLKEDMEYVGRHISARLLVAGRPQATIEIAYN